jgi:hypothetical protein
MSLPNDIIKSDTGVGPGWHAGSFLIRYYCHLQAMGAGDLTHRVAVHPHVSTTLCIRTLLDSYLATLHIMDRLFVFRYDGDGPSDSFDFSQLN